jgi:phospholipase C
VETGHLPQVSFIVSPEAYSEHPNWVANWGAWYISKIIDILVENPELWSKTVFLINYDEEGGFFDHMVPPTPPMTPAHGDSTVSTRFEIFPGASRVDGTFFQPGPIGLGERVAMLVVSPWSKGGFVNSQLFDHTSVIKFLEARFGRHKPDLFETNITPWRRAVTGNLTTAFDFEQPERWRDIELPSTESFLPDLERHDDYPAHVPANQVMPGQEKGVRPARALPYALEALGRSVGNQFRIDFLNAGHQTAVFHARSANAADLPRCYTVEPRESLTGLWPLGANNSYDVSVHGPNGFFRSFTGRVSDGSARLRIQTESDWDDETVRFVLHLTNRSGRRVTVRVFNRYTGKTLDQLLDHSETMSRAWNLRRFYGWYEFVVKVLDDHTFEYRLAGHLENGQDSFSDPLMGGLI